MDNSTIFTSAERDVILGDKKFVPETTLQSAINYHEVEITKLDAMGLRFGDHVERQHQLERILDDIEFNGEITIPV